MSASLANYAAFLKDRYLFELAAEQLRLMRDLDLPLFQALDMPAEAQLERTRRRLALTLSELAAGRGEAYGQQRIREWMTGKLPGLGPENTEPSDLVLSILAEKQAFQAFIQSYSQDEAMRRLLKEALDRYFTKYRSDALEALLRAKAAVKIDRNRQA